MKQFFSNLLFYAIICTMQFVLIIGPMLMFGTTGNPLWLLGYSVLVGIFIYDLHDTYKEKGDAFYVFRR